MSDLSTQTSNLSSSMGSQTNSTTAPTPKLTPASRLLLAAIGFNAAGGALSGIFINVYLLKMSGSLLQVLAFHLATFTAWVPAFILSGWLGKKVGRTRGMMLGNVGSLILYLSVLLLGDAAGHYAALLGVLNGIALGSYWMSVNILVIDVTTIANRDLFNGVNGMILSLTQLFGPLLAGVLIAGLPNEQGYTIVFTLSTILYGVSILLGWRIPVWKDTVPIAWRKIGTVHRRPDWRAMSYSFTALHFRDDVLGFVLWLWIYAVTRSESAMGGFAFLLTLCSAVTYYLVGRRKSGLGTYRTMVIGTVGFSAGLLLLWLGMNPYTFAAYTVLAGICAPLFNLPFNSMLMNSIAASDEGGRYRTELIISRELSISLGRIASAAGLALLLKFGVEPLSALQGYVPLLVVAGILPLVWVRRRVGNGSSNS